MIKAASVVKWIAINHFIYNRLDSRRSSAFGECLQRHRDAAFRLCPPQLDADGPAIRFTPGGQGAVAARVARPTHRQTMQHLPELRFCRAAIAHIVILESRHAAQAEDLARHPGSESGGWKTCCSGCRRAFAVNKRHDSAVGETVRKILGTAEQLPARRDASAALTSSVRG